MPTTDNQNQDKTSTEESVLPQSNIESFTNEMATTEQHEFINQDDKMTLDASDSGVTNAEQPEFHTQVDPTTETSSGTELTTTEEPEIINQEDEIETSESNDEANRSAMDSEVSAQSDVVLDSGAVVNSQPDPSNIQLKQYVQEDTSMNIAAIPLEAGAEPSNVMSETVMDTEVLSNPESGSVGLHHESSDLTDQQVTTEVSNSNLEQEHMDVDPCETSMTSGPEMTSKCSETVAAGDEHAQELFQSVGENPQSNADVDITSIQTSTSECTTSSSYSASEVCPAQTSFRLEDASPEASTGSSVSENISSKPFEPSDKASDHHLAEMEHAASNQLPEVEGDKLVPIDAANENRISEVNESIATENVQVPSEQMKDIANVNETISDFSVEQHTVSETISEALQSPDNEPLVSASVSKDTPDSDLISDTGIAKNITPSGTALMTDIFDDDFSPPQTVISTQPSQKQTISLSQSSTSSFQSAFAAFASAASTTKAAATAEEESASTLASKTVTQEQKKISLLPMPGELSEPVPSHSNVAKEPVTDLGMDQTAMQPSVTEQADQNQVMESETATEMSSESTVASDAVYFIQMADAAGEVVTSIIDPNDIASYSDSVVYKQCMGADGQIETTIVSSGGMVYQEEQAQQPQVETPPEPQQEMEQQVIYAHDLNGQLTPIDSSQSANDVAPPGKQFVYMQDSSGRIIRTIMDANQTMVPGQQVYYTQSEDGRIITSVMDSESSDQSTAATDYQPQQTQIDQEAQQQLVQQQQQDQAIGDGAVAPATQQGFAMDNSMSGLSMLAELTAGQAPVDLKRSSNAGNSSQDADMDEFRPVAMITRRVTEDGVETVNSDMAGLKMTQGSQAADVSSESMLTKLTTEIIGSTWPVSVSKDNLFVQWQNLDALCWMDVVLIMLVYSPSLQPLVNMDPSHELASTLLITLLKANRQAQVLIQNLLKRSEANVQNGSGITTTVVKEARTSRLACKENMDEIGKAINILYAMREQIWQALQPRLQCERGKHNSPVLVLPLLVREKPIIKQMFTMKFRYVFKCDKCGYTQDDTHSKILPTIPAVPPNFNMKNPCFVRNCFECKAPNQRMHMKFEGLQDFVQMHFVKGLPHNRFDELSFDHNDDHYEVTAVVHYKNNPDHFIAWVRNAPGNAWMECDDLKSVITRYQTVKPTIPPSQVHMVMWERRLTPRHIQVMRDTEDTRILSSLVLTVQQPGQDAAKPPTPATTTLGATTGMVQGTASSVLSGLISQSQNTLANFSPYTPRGRGARGGIRGRGGRGRGINNVTTLRRGVNNQLIAPSLPGATVTRPANSPQIIRLPLSALQGMGAQLRGSTPGTASPQRVILVGGNNNAAQTSSATGVPQQKKVVVLRSQDGSTSLNQLSATQLLQLLQRSGAISGNSNTRITTTISKASSDGTTQQQTITLTPTVPTEANAPTTAQGQVLSSSVSTPAQAENTEAVSLAQTEPATQTLTDSLNQASPLATSETPGEALTGPISETPMDVEPVASTDESQVATSVSDLGGTGVEAMQASVSDSGIVTEPTSSIVTQVSSSVSMLTSQATSTPESVDSQSKSSTLTLNSGAIRALARTGLSEGNRYLQIPNPKGGPNIMTRLIVRGDKMMLVPVEKSTASETTTHSSTTSSSLLSSSPSSSSVRTSSSLLSAALQSSTLIPPASSLSASFPTSTINTSSAPTTRYITIPGNQGTGGKRTIQLISVPKGSAAAAGASPTRTLILGQPAAGGHQPSSTTTTRIISQSLSGGDAVSAVSQQLQQGQTSGNIFVRELKQSEESNNTLTSSVTLSDESGTQTPLHGGPVSLLANASTALEDRSQGISILSSSSVQTPSRTQESFKYILPGSNTQQMASIQTLSGAQLGSKAFTALSSSGTIIGGQLTTVNTADMTPSPVDSVDAGVQSLYPELDAISPTVLTPSRGRGGRGNRGGRGSRARGSVKPMRGGRGGRQNTIILGQQQQQHQLQANLAGQPGTVTMLPADFHGIGGQIIQTSTESVDGAPVVSIPDFSSAAVSLHAESQQIVSESGLITSANTVDPLCPPPVESVSLSSSLHQSPMNCQEEATPEATANQGPRVITQSIPSIKANHGFDILTQGILGNTQTPPLGATRKTGISLLTGKTVTSPPLISSPPSSSSATLFASDMTRMQQTLAMGHSVSQNEIETLIKAAQGAAKPPKPGEYIPENAGEHSSNDIKHNQMGTVESKTSTQEQTRFNVDDFLNEARSGDKSMVGENTEVGEQKKDNDTEEDSMDVSESVGKQRVFSVDESQVSAAERYRMPTELFQPDEESPEKPVRSDSISRHISGSNILGEDLPSKLFLDSEISSQEDEMVRSPPQQIPLQGSVKSPEKQALYSHVEKDREVEENVNNDIGVEDETMNEGDQVREEEKIEHLQGSPKAKNKRSGSRKKRSSSKHSFSEKEDISVDFDSSSMSPDKNVISSPMEEEELNFIGHKKEVCVGGFASDILNENKGVENLVGNVCEGEAKADKVETFPNDVKGSVSETEEEMEKKFNYDSAKVCSEKKDNLIMEKKQGKENASPAARRKKSRKRVFDLPKAFVVNKKQKVDWSSEELKKSSKVFSYSLLSRTRNRKCSPRHVSLGPVISLFTSSPAPFAGPREKEDLHELLTCVVKRRQVKALERPKVDPSKEPTVIPLVPEEDADPACTFGGSVVTIPDKGEMFTGVVVRQRREVADWNSVIYDEEGDSFVDRWLDKESMQEYIETMWTSMCMEIDFADFFDKCDYNGDEDVLEEEEDYDEEDDDEEEEEINDNFQNIDDIKEKESAIVTREGADGENVSSALNGNDSDTMRSPNNGDGKRNEEEMEVDSKEMLMFVEESCNQVINDKVANAVSNSVTLDNDISSTATPAPKEESLPSSHGMLPTSPTTSNIAKKISTIQSSPSKPPITSTSRFNGFPKSESVVSTLPFIHSVTPASSISLLSPPPNLSPMRSSAATIPLSSSSTTSGTSQSSTAISSNTSPSSSVSKKRTKSSAPTPTPSFISPTRRSSRTPVPSLKVRDSLEDGVGGLAMKMLSKNRRSSVLSSDDELSGSGYSSDEVAIKKKTKKFHVTS